MAGPAIVAVPASKSSASGAAAQACGRALVIMTVAAAEAAVGLAIVITVYRLRHTIQVDEIDLLKG